MSVLLLLICTSLPTLSSQTLPIRLRPAHTVPADTGAARAEDVLGAYLRKRLDALGLKVVEDDGPESALEFSFSVLPLPDEAYDIAGVINLRNCGVVRKHFCLRGAPLDWSQLHEYKDLEEAARAIGENLYGEAQGGWQVLSSIDTIPVQYTATPKKP